VETRQLGATKQTNMKKHNSTQGTPRIGSGVLLGGWLITLKSCSLRSLRQQCERLGQWQDGESLAISAGRQTMRAATYFLDGFYNLWLASIKILYLLRIHPRMIRFGTSHLVTQVRSSCMRLWSWCSYKSNGANPPNEKS
jgi:hypothetical protein